MSHAPGAFDRLKVTVRKLWGPTLFGVVVVSCGLLICELVLAFLVAHPRFTANLPPTLRDAAQMAYMYARPVPQYLYGRPDPLLGYRMKEGAFPFATAEFDTTLRFNSQGLRSTEESLRAPEIIFVGDSVTLGWGVEEEETFAHRVAGELGWRGLNAGVSSYGTAREMMLLRQLDTSALRWIVLQHHANDAKENLAFHEAKGHLPVMSEELFCKLAEREQYKNLYLRLPHVRGFFRGLLSRNEEVTGKEFPLRKEIGPFFEALNSVADHVPRGVRMLLIDVGGKTPNGPRFGSLVAEKARTGSYPEWIKSITFVDLSEVIAPEDSFVLDPHPDAGGHAKISGEILKAIRASEAKEATRPAAAANRH